MRTFSQAYTADACRKIDHRAIHALGVPGIELMHRAGRCAFGVLRESWPHARHVTVCCGAGNNAGDGFVLAGLARREGLTVQALAESVESFRGDARSAYEWMLEQGVRPTSAGSISGEVVVDALLGTGAKGPPRAEIQARIDAIRGSGRPVLAVDVPSGIDPSTGGKLTDRPVIADATATFVGVKLGLLTGEGPNCTGELRYFDLALPATAFDNIAGIPLIPIDASERCLPVRRAGAYKNQHGHVLVVAGGRGMGGAATLTSLAALRTGAGLVSVATHQSHAQAVLARCPEAMVHGASPEGPELSHLLDRASVVVVGPGLGMDTWASGMLSGCLESSKPLVLDADALNLLSKQGQQAPKGSILTPHPGEAARLLSRSPGDVQADRSASAVELSVRHTSTVALKGAGTLVANDGHLHGICAVACAALATGGSGDVLAGIIGATRANAHSPATAASLGVWLHAQAGMQAQSKAGRRAVIAGDIVKRIQPWPEESRSS